MKRVKEIWSVLAAVIIISLSIPALVFAGSMEEAQGRYDAAECTKGDDSYTCEGEYLLLNEDGSGEIRFNDNIYTLDWELDGTNLSFQDEEGEKGTGTLENGRIEAEYMDYDYVYIKAQDAQKDGLVSQAANTADSSDGASGAQADENSQVNDSVQTAQDPVDLASIRTGSGPVVYDVTAREVVSGASGITEDSSVWKLDYIAMNDDGTGVFMFNMAAFSIRWKLEGTKYTFTDHRGNQFTGTVDGNRITGVYGKYRYTFVQSDLELPVYSIAPDRWNKGLPPVTDQADKLTDAQEQAYTRKAQELTDKYDVGVYVVLLDSSSRFTWTGNMQSLGEEIWAGYSLGVGATDKKASHAENANEAWKDSIILTVSFDNRKYDICVTGSYADWAFNPASQEMIRDHFVDDFRENQWNTGIGDFLDSVEDELDLASKGHVYSFKYSGMGRMIGIIAPIVLAVLFGYGIAALMRASMKDTQEAQNASVYVSGSKMKFTRREDRYIRTLVSRVYSPREKSSSGGGAGGHSSSGSSHTSGSF